MLIGFWYTVVSMKGMYLSDNLHTKHELEARFNRVAWVARHACNGQSDQIINIHCPSMMTKSNTSSTDPFILAATASYDTMLVNSTLLQWSPITITKEHWISNQQVIQYILDAIIGPWILVPMFILYCVGLICIPCYCLQMLKINVDQRKVNMAQHNRSLDSVLQDSFYYNQETTTTTIKSNPQPNQQAQQAQPIAFATIPASSRSPFQRTGYKMSEI